MLALLGAAVLVTLISVALVGVMDTDLTHAPVQYAVSRSFYIARARRDIALMHTEGGGRLQTIFLTSSER